jgi:hypothetical protein
MSSGTVGAATEVEAEKEAGIVCCANCGIAQVDDIKLEDCDAWGVPALLFAAVA